MITITFPTQCIKTPSGYEHSQPDYGVSVEPAVIATQLLASMLLEHGFCNYKTGDAYARASLLLLRAETIRNIADMYLEGKSTDGV